MAKKSMIEREKKRQALVEKYAAKRAELKEQMRQLKTSEDFNPADAQAIAEQLQKLPRNASPVRVVNRCNVTGRRHGYIRKFGMSRITFREEALSGMIPGVTKASW